LARSFPPSTYAAGNLKFTAAPGVSVPAYIRCSFRLQDDGGTRSGVDLEATAHTMTVDVMEINQAPQGTDNTVNLLEDTPYVSPPPISASAIPAIACPTNCSG
jgi:hypothetical protein